jgi:hypothetical protein
MAILKNVELYFCKLDPASPNSRFDTENPTWETQIRTKDKAQAKSWKDMNIRVTPDEDKDGKVFYRANLKKKSKKRDGTDQAPVQVVGGDLSPIDTKNIGNGSIANARVYQYDYNVGGKEGVATMLMAVQITELHEYSPKPREDDFEMLETKVIKVADNQDLSEEVSTSRSERHDDDLNF